MAAAAAIRHDDRTMMQTDAGEPDRRKRIVRTGDMKVLVTGAAGMVGRAVVPVLRSAGHRVVATDLPGAAPAADVHADLADAVQADALIGDAGFDAVVHAAAIPSPGQHPPHVVFANNMMATFNVIEACMRSGARRLVNISSVGVLGLHYATRRFLPDYLPIDEQHQQRPQDPYGLSKLFGDQLCDAAVRRSDLRCISLRPAWVQDAASYAADLGPLIRAGQPRGVAGWPYIDVSDLAGAVRLAVQSDLPRHEAFYIAAPDTIGGVDLHASWRTANPGSPTDLRPVPRPDASGIDSGKAQRLLGWQATRSWRDYLTDSGEPR
jgi:UDP-glucose 4-epimerase